MIEKNINLQKGIKVTYCPTHYELNEFEIGFVNSVNSNGEPFVRYINNFTGMLENTSKCTNKMDLVIGWVKQPSVTLYDILSKYREPEIIVDLDYIEYKVISFENDSVKALNKEGKEVVLSFNEVIVPIY